MKTNLERFRQDMNALNELGNSMELDLLLQNKESRQKLSASQAANAKQADNAFQKQYQNWYSQGLAMLKQILPDRTVEFTYLYHGDGRRKDILAQNYSIQDWLNGIRAGEDYKGSKRFDDLAIVIMRFGTQRAILESAEKRFESSLFDIAHMVRADLFDSELESAKALLESGFIRCAGAIAGVILEKHLASVCASRNLKLRKARNSINDYNDILKEGAVIEIIAWRLIQRLSDIRNLCDHNKDREPRKDEVAELIENVDKIAKTVL